MQGGSAGTNPADRIFMVFLQLVRMHRFAGLFSPLLLEWRESFEYTELPVGYSCHSMNRIGKNPRSWNPLALMAHLACQ
jgi:hypothetical protein